MILNRRRFLHGAVGSAAGLALGTANGQDKAAAERATATSWPQFKGDAARTGDNPAARLRVPLRRVLAMRFPAPIYASPAVVEDHVFIQDAHGHAACIDSRSRKVVWTASLGGFNNTSSPAVLDGKVYIGATTGVFHVLDARTGKTIKQVKADGPVVTAPAVANRAVYFSTLDGKLIKLDLAGSVVWSFDGGKTSITDLAIRGDRIAFFAGGNNTIQYLLRDTSDRVEVVQKRPSSEQTCPTSGPVLVSDSDYAYQCFDSEFGTFFLSDRVLTIDTQDTRGVPSVRGRLLYRGDKCWDLDAIDPAKLKKHPQQSGVLANPLWRADVQSLYDGGFHSSPALAKDYLVIGAEPGRLLFYPLEGSDKVRKPVWTFETTRAGRPQGAISSSPAVVDGHVYFGGEDGILYGLGDGPEAEVIDVSLPARKTSVPVKLSGSEWPTPGGDMGFSFVAPPTTVRPPFEVQWRTRLWSTFKGPMIVAEGKVFCGGRSGLLAALDAASGEILWKTHHPGVESRAAPTCTDGKLFLLRVQGNQGDSPHVIGASGGPRGEGLWCHDAATGEKRWHRPMPFAYHFNADGLAVAGGKVFCCETDAEGQLHAVALAAADGKESWRTKLEGIAPGRNRPVRFAGAIADGVWCVALRGWTKGKPGGAFALDAETGKLLWRKEDLGLEVRSRVAARGNLLVVFDRESAHALEPRTGKVLWVGVGRDKTGSDTYAMQPLTDAFLESKGQRTLTVRGCANPIFANGLCYSHDTRSAYSSNSIIVKDGAKIIWEQAFLSNACPSPVPAYDRLYFAPNAEGVVYCFRSPGGG